MVSALVIATTPQAADDKAALAGLKEVKAAFDLRVGDAKGLLNRLDIIDETRQSLIRQGVEPHSILAFRGPATKLVQTDVNKITPVDRALGPRSFDDPAIVQTLRRLIEAP